MAFLIFSLTCGFWESGRTSIFNLVIRIITAVSAIAFFYNLVVQSKWNNYADKLIWLIGVNTLPIYILHWYFLSVIPLASNWLLAFIELLLFAICISLICIGIAKMLGHSEILNFIFLGKIRKQKKMSDEQNEGIYKEINMG